MLKRSHEVDNQPAPCRFGGHDWLVDGRGVLFWPRHRMLIVSDLHLEKGSFLRRYGHSIPALDTHDTINRLQAVCKDYAPDVVICLGDSFHDRQAELRLRQEDKARLNQLCASCQEWIWITGNHDPELPAGLAGRVLPFLHHDAIAFHHEPADVRQRQIIGHFHPKMRLRLQGQTIRGKAMLHDEQRMVMPAFGSFTGGLDWRDVAIQSLFQTSPERYLFYHEQVWHLDRSSTC